MKECILCGATKTSQWYKGPFCKSCYSKSPKARATTIRRLSKPDVRFNKSKRQALSRGKEWSIELEQFIELLKQPCYYCSNLLGTKEGFSSCLDRLDNNVGYLIDNVIPCCYVCNTLRNQFLSVEETKLAVDAVVSFRKSKLLINLSIGSGMDNFLQSGDRFISSKLSNLLHGEIARDALGKILFDVQTKEPYVDFSNLHTEDYDAMIVVPWKEFKEDGWSRDRQTKLYTKVNDKILLSATWIVIETSLTGGGTAHGLHDIYPDGHHVIAQRVGGIEKVAFFQSGSFRGMIEPKYITTV